MDLRESPKFLQISLFTLFRPQLGELHADLMSERPEKAIATCKGAAYLNGELACETEITIAMR